MALAILLLAAPAHATCLLGSVSGTVPWDAKACPTDPNMPSDNYSATITGPTVLQPPANMPPTGDKFITLWLNYGAGGSLSLGAGFVGTDEISFCNKAGCYEEVVCHIHALNNPLGQGPFCDIHSGIHSIGAPPAPTGGVARGSGSSVTLPLAAATGSTVLCGALTGSTPSMTVSDDAGDRFTGFDASRTNTGHPLQMFKSEKIAGSPKNFKLTISGSDSALVLRCDVLPPGTVLASSQFTNQITVPAGTDAVKSNPLAVSAGDGLYAFALCSCGTLSSIAAGTGYTLASPSDLAPGATYPMNVEVAVAAASTGAIATFTIADKGNNWNVDLIKLGK